MKSQEDHGYILDFGISDISGFLPFSESRLEDLKNEDTKLHVGVLLDVTIVKIAGNGRTCTVSADRATFTSSYVCLRSPLLYLSAHFQLSCQKYHPFHQFFQARLYKP